MMLINWSYSTIDEFLSNRPINQRIKKSITDIEEHILNKG